MIQYIMIMVLKNELRSDLRNQVWEFYQKIIKNDNIYPVSFDKCYSNKINHVTKKMYM